MNYGSKLTCWTENTSKFGSLGHLLRDHGQNPQHCRTEVFTLLLNNHTADQLRQKTEKWCWAGHQMTEILQDIKELSHQLIYFCWNNLKQFYFHKTWYRIYMLHWNIIHKSTGVTWNVGQYKLIRLPGHNNLNLNLTKLNTISLK